MLFSSEWYPALASDNVDVETDAVTEVTTTGVRTADGRLHDVDVIIYGTGFKATEFLAPMKISGRQGRDLHADWSSGARAHLGMAVPGFPNMFLIYGPNTNLGSSSTILMMEQQAGYIRQVVQELARRGNDRAFEIRRCGGGGIRHGDAGPPRRRGLDQVRILVSIRLGPGNHQLAGAGPRISTPHADRGPRGLPGNPARESATKEVGA